MSEPKHIFVKRGLAGYNFTFVPKNYDSFKILEEAKTLKGEKTNPDIYTSIYYFTDEQKDAIIKNKSIGNVVDVVTDRLVLDFDSTDLEQTKKDTIVAVDRLKEAGFKEENMQISFSGNKGFHVEVQHDRNLSPEEHKTLANHFIGDLDGFDPSIYNGNRIFRLTGSKHNKSIAHKTPLTFEQLKDADVTKIKEVCSNPEMVKSQMKSIKIVPAKFPKNITIQKIEKPKNISVDMPTEVSSIDFSQKPPWLTKAKYVLHRGFIPDGKSNEAFMILAATYKNAGLDMIDAYHSLKGVNEKRGNIFGEEYRKDNNDIWKEIITTVYSPAWSGGSYNQESSDLLNYISTEYKLVDNKTDLVGMTEMHNSFLKFAANIKNNIITTGIAELDSELMITTGMMIGVLGAPSSGKTSFANSFAENVSIGGNHVLYESLDMDKNLLHQRLLQRGKDIACEKLMRKTIPTYGGKANPFYDPNYDILEDIDLKEAYRAGLNLYKNVTFNFNRGATVETIEEDIIHCKEKHGDTLKLVVVDYLEKVRGPFSDSTANSGFVASRLSDLASKHEVAILLLLQPQKSAGDASEELLSMRKVKGASVIEQDCRMILTIWRPGFSPKSSDDDCYTSVAVVKNNMGGLKTFDFAWDGLKGSLRSLKGDERGHLNALRKEIKEEKEKEKQDKSPW